MAAHMTPQTGEPWVPDDSFRNRLGVVRVALGGLNIKEAAGLCGISPESWRRWEDGASPRGLEDVCERISVATGIDYRWLIAGGPLRTGSYQPALTALPEPCGQGSLLGDDMEPFDFFFRPQLASV